MVFFYTFLNGLYQVIPVRYLVQWKERDRGSREGERERETETETETETEKRREIER